MKAPALVVLAARDRQQLDAAASAFKAAGWLEGELAPAAADTFVPLAGPAADVLREADAAGFRYTLVHVGDADGEPGGSHERAHHRIEPEDAAGLAATLRSRDRPLVTCLAFAYKNGVPPDAAWVVDVRFLDNPYWVPELRHLSGQDVPVADYVLRQPAAVELIERLEAVLMWVIPLYQGDHLTVAFGCTGGRHRSVALAAEMARRLATAESIDVEFVTRDLGP
jgi:hypothetical protein